MIIRMKLANTFITSNSYPLCVCSYVVRTFKIYSLSNFQVFSTIPLSIFTMLYTTSSGLIHITGSLYLFWPCLSISPGFPSGSDGKESSCQCKRPRFNPWIGKVPWRREWQPTAVFLPREFHGQRSLVGYTPWGHKELDMAKHACERVHINTHKHVYTHPFPHPSTTELSKLFLLCCFLHKD